MFTWPGGSLLYNFSSTCDPGCGVTFYLPNGTYTLIIPHAIPIRYGTQYATPGIRGLGITVNGSGELYLFGYSLQFLLQTGSAPPSLGRSVLPATRWVDNATNVSLSATDPPGWQFESWRGSGAGNYSGLSRSALVSILSPINETAIFEPTYAVTFTESGLPSLAQWSVHVGSTTVEGTTPQLTAQLVNGSYAYNLSSPISDGYGTRFVPISASGTLQVSGGPTGVSVSFQTQFRVGVSVVPLGAGSVDEAGGWFAQGSSLSLVASAASSSWTFDRWSAQGLAGYSGPSNPVTVIAAASFNETARFVPLYQLFLEVVPRVCGPVLLNGTSEGNGSIAPLRAGSYPITAPTCSGHEFGHWVASGGTSVTDPNSANTTTALTTNATLTAVYVASEASIAPFFLLLTADLGLLATLIGEAVLIVRTDRQRAKGRRDITRGQ